MKGKSAIVFIIVILLLGSTTRAATLTIHITNLRNDNSQVVASLFNKKEGFPQDRNAIIALEKSGAILDNKAMLTFKNLQPGYYAVAIMHDESMNDDMDYNLIGIPKEGYCFSNNVKPMLRAPSFEATKIWVEADTTIQVQMRYWGKR